MKQSLGGRLSGYLGRVRRTESVLAVVALVAIIYAVVGGLLGLGFYPIAAPIAVCLLLWFAVRPEIALISLSLFFLVVDYWSSRGDLPHQLIYVPDLVVVAFTVRALWAWKTRAIKWPPRTTLWMLAGLLLLCVVSALINHSGMMQTIAGLRSYLRWPLICVLMIAIGLSSATVRRFLVLFVFLGLVQIPVAIGQYAVYGGRTELVTGTFANKATHELLFVCMLCIVLIAGYSIRRRRLPYLAGLLCVLLAVPPVLGYVRASVVVFPVLFCVLIGYALCTRAKDISRSSTAKFAVSTVVIALIVFGAISPLRNAVAENVQGIQAVGGMVAGESRDMELAVTTTTDRFGHSDQSCSDDGQAETVNITGRIAALDRANDLASTSVITGLFGYGPGATLKSYVSSSPLRDADFDILKSQVSATLLDLGYTGTVLLVLILASLFLAIPRLKGDASAFWRALGWSAPVLLVLYLVMLVYYPVWTYARAIPFSFWLLAAATFARADEIRGGQGETDDPRTSPIHNMRLLVARITRRRGAR